MGVPKCKKKKSKRNDPYLVKAERVLKSELDKSYNQTAQDMSRTAGSIYHLALERAFGFTLDDDKKLQAEIQKISDEVVAGTLTIEDITKHQEEKGSEFV